MKKIEHKSLSLRQLKQKFDDQIFAIPEIQRSYVWDAKRVCQLLDSIYNHYPIGVGLIWKTNSTKNVEIRPNNKTIIPPFHLNNSSIEFVIDGQQRLSSLYGVMFGISPDKEKTTTDFTKIFFKLKNDGKDRFVYSNKLNEGTKGYIAVHNIFKKSSSILIKKQKLTQAEAKELRTCVSKFQSYRYHMLVLNTNSIDEIRETFIRINSQGMTVQKADTLFAKTAKIGLRDLVEATRRSLISNGFNKLDTKYFIYTLALSDGETTIGKTALDAFHKKFERKNIGKKEFSKIWKKYHNAFTMAKDHLRDDFGITEYRLLPSANMFTILSLFFYLHPKRPTSAQKNEIRKWFWHTALGERYSGNAFGKNIPSDVTFFKKLATKHAVYNVIEKINPWDFLKKKYNSPNSSATVGYFLFLRKRNPRYFDTGELMLLDDITSIANRKDRHHIFPDNLLRRKAVNPKWINAIVNICLLPANDNQSISNKHPKNYLLVYKKKTFFRKVMSSHLIPSSSSIDGVWNSNVKKGFLDFINTRGAVIIREIQKTSGINKLFEPLTKLTRI